MTTGVPDEGGAVNAARRRFLRQTLGGVGYMTATVAVISEAAVFSVYTYTTVAAREADAEAVKRTVAAREKSAHLILPVSVFSLALLAVAGACFWTRRFLALGNEDASGEP
jgi:hypothetical protein